MKQAWIYPVAVSLGLFGLACNDDGGGDDEVGSAGTDTATTTGDGDTTGNEETGDTQGTTTGDGDTGSTDTTGDGDTGTTDTTGDGDTGTDTTGDGDTGTTDTTGDGDTGTTDTTGDGDTTTTTGGDMCGAPGEHIICDEWGSDPTPLQAIGLNCPGNANNSTQTTADSWTAPDGETWRIGTQYGTSGDWVPSEGESLLVISSGKIPAPDGNGLITSQGNQSSTGNPDGQPLPAPMSPNVGSNNGAGGTPFMDCDGVNDCSDSLQSQWMLGGGDANDLLWFQYSVMVPEQTTGWELDFVYFSNEFPEYVNSTFNDIFVVWEVSESYVGNMCFIDGQPCTVTALDAVADAFSGPNEADHPSLAGTGTQGSGSTGGQTTGWVTLEGPAAPLEEMQLTYAIFDMGDTAFDTMVVMDNWRWNCVGCVPSEVNSCGVQPQ